MPRRELFFAPGANRAVELEGDPHAPDAVHVRPFAATQAAGASARSASAAGSASAGGSGGEVAAARLSAPPRQREMQVVDAELEQARDHFDQIFCDLTRRLESEYDRQYTAAPPELYASRATATAPPERLAWWNGGAKPDHPPPAPVTGEQSASFFQDQRASFKRHVGRHVMNEESQPSLWGCGGEGERLSESRERYRAPPEGFARPRRAHEPPETISLGLDLSADRAEGEDEAALEALRESFREDMGRLHRTDMGSGFISEYDARYTSPAERETRSYAERKAGSLGDSEHGRAFAAFDADKLAAVRAAPSAGMRPAPRTGIELGHTLEMGPWAISEYDASFLPNDKLQAAAAERAEAARELEARRDEALQRRASSAAAEAAAAAARRFSLGEKEHTEYRDRFCHAGSTEGMDRGFVSSPRHSKRIAPRDRFVTEYNVEFDHAEPKYELDKKKEPAPVIDEEDMASGMVSEYEGSFCGHDLLEARKRLESARAEASKRVALKPAYSLQGTGTHKHRLFEAEINPGFVSRTEQMAAFTDPQLRPHKTGEFLATQRLRDGKRTVAEPPAEATQRREAEQPRLSHEELLAKESARSLHWWRNSGQRLWETLNPIALNKRYAGARGSAASAYKTEYQRAFEAKQPVAA